MLGIKIIVFSPYLIHVDWIWSEPGRAGYFAIPPSFYARHLNTQWCRAIKSLSLWHAALCNILQRCIHQESIPLVETSLQDPHNAIFRWSIDKCAREDLWHPRSTFLQKKYLPPFIGWSFSSDIFCHNPSVADLSECCSTSLLISNIGKRYGWPTLLF